MALHSQEPRRLMPAGEATTVPADAGANGVGAARSWLDALAKPTAFVALLGYPLTLTSPGATVAMILVGLYGLALALRDGLPEDLRRVHRSMLACYLLVVVVDVLNGSIVASLLSTGVNYLPLLALAPYANALRRLPLSSQTLDRAMVATVLIAAVMSGFDVVVAGEIRPGGLNLGSVPYSFVTAVWGTFLLSRGLRATKPDWLLMVVAAVALATVVSGQSKIALLAMLVGYVVVGVQWAYENHRMRAFAWTTLVVGGVTVGIFALVARERIRDLVFQIEKFIFEDNLYGGTFGDRYELVTSGLRAFADNWLLGYGFQGRMEAVIARLKHTDIGVQTLGHLHNDYITHMVSFGVFGLVFLVAYIALTYRLVVRSGDVAYQRASVALLSMLVIYMAAEVAFNMDPITSLVTLAFGMALSRAPAERVAAADGAVDGKSTKPD